MLAYFDNSTGDPEFDGALKEAVALQLERSPYFNILPESRVQQALHFMGRPAGERLTKEVAHEICLREGISTMLVGSIANFGTHYVITLEVINAQSEDALARAQAEAGSKEQILKSLEQAATSLQQKLGDTASPASLQKLPTPLEAATTSSLDALREFSLGHAALAKYDQQGSLPHYQKAVELDPNFAMAWAELATVQNNLGNEVPAFVDFQKAFELRDRASDHERYNILADYYGLFKKDYVQAIPVYEEWIQKYPRDNVARDNLSWNYYLIGRYENAVEQANAGLSNDPKDVYSINNLAMTRTFSWGDSTMREAFSRRLAASRSISAGHTFWIFSSRCFAATRQRLDVTLMVLSEGWRNRTSTNCSATTYAGEVRSARRVRLSRTVWKRLTRGIRTNTAEFCSHARQCAKSMLGLQRKRSRT